MCAFGLFSTCLSLHLIQIPHGIYPRNPNQFAPNSRPSTMIHILSSDIAREEKAPLDGRVLAGELEAEMPIQFYHCVKRNDFDGFHEISAHGRKVLNPTVWSLESQFITSNNLFNLTKKVLKG